MKIWAILIMVCILVLAIENFESKLEGIEFQLATIELQTNDVRNELVYEYVTIVSEKYVTNFYAENWSSAYGYGMACMLVKQMLDGEQSLQEIEKSIELFEQAPNLEEMMSKEKNSNNNIGVKINE